MCPRLSKLAKPLTDLLPPASTKMNKSKKIQKESNWTELEQEAFIRRKTMLTKPPGLAFSDFQQPFELALKWAVTEKCKNYLMGSHFTVFTDNTHILTSAKLDATGQR